MKKIPLSQQGKHAGKYFALVDDEDYQNLSKYNWSVFNQNKKIKYAARKIRVNKIPKILFMHRIILRCPPNLFGDHIDGDGLNNQKYNLRIATKQNNNSNKTKLLRNISGFKGVGYRKDIKKFSARICFNYKEIFLGYFNTNVEAAKAYNKKALELFGEFANINQICEQ